MENIKTEIKSFEKQLNELEKKKGKIKSLESERIEKYHDLLNKYLEWKKHYERVIIYFSEGQSKILNGINFESTIHFVKKDFVECGFDILDQRKINIDEITEYAEKLETIITEDTNEISKEKIKKFIEQISEKKGILKKRRTNHDFYKWIFDDYFILNTEIFFKGTPMKKLSMGQRGTVLLKLFLAEGDYPLIIDQPEENLDNKFIYDELVDAFREAKKKRQVIIATNNANLVVNTDAEQIIVAEFKDNIISYKSSALENLEMREDITPILEGGEEAFRKRGERYGI